MSPDRVAAFAIELTRMPPLSLTLDHRVVAGDEAALIFAMQASLECAS